MGEIVAVLVVFFIIVLIGFVVYFSVLRGEIEERTQEAKDVGSVGVVQAVLAMPELQCSDNNVVKEKCVDLLKLKASAECDIGCYKIIKNDATNYFDIFGFSEIKFKQIYPAAVGSPSEWIIYDNKLTDAGGRDISSSKLRTEIPIILHDPVERKNNFGILNITTYSR